MTENNSVPSSPEINTPLENSSPTFELTAENVDNAVEELSSQMSVDVNKLMEEPKDGNWDLKDYLECVTFTPDNEKISKLGITFDKVPTVENLQTNEEMDSNTKVLLLLTTEAMLNTAVEGFENDSEAYKLKEVIDDVHPDWKNELNSYRNDIRKILDEVNYSENSKSSLFEDVRNALDFNSNKRRAYNALAIIALSAGLLSSCNEIEAIGSYNTEPFVDEPKATTTYTPTNTEVVEATETIVPTQTNTTEPTQTETPEVISYKPTTPAREEYERLGYGLSIYAQDIDFREAFWPSGVSVFSSFTYEGYERSLDGIRLVGTIDLDGEQYQLKLRINDPKDARYKTAGSNAYSLDEEAVEKWYKEGLEYWFAAFPTHKASGEIFLASSLDSYSEEEWKEIRENVEDLLKNGGENDQYYLALDSTIVKRD